MADNPYQGQEGYERAWSDGFDRGQHNPHEDQPAAPSAFPPYDLDQEMLSYFQQVWLEGHLAGRQAPINPNVQHHEQDSHNPLSDGLHYFEYGSVVKNTLTRHFFAAAVELFLAVMIPSGAPRWTEEEGDLHTWFAAACREYSWDEFFVPVVWGQSDEAPGWHGSAYTTFDAAKLEADPYVLQGSAIEIAHYRCDTPSMMEMIELGSP